MNKGIHRRAGLLAFLFLCLLLQACVSSGSRRSQASFQKGETLYAQGRYEQASDQFSSVLRNPRSREDDEITARAYQLRGECHEALRQYSLARSDYQDAYNVADAAGPDFFDRETFLLQCRIRTGDTYMLDGAYLKADQTFQELLWRKPPAAQRDAILYRRYLCAVKLNRADPEEYLRQIQNRNQLDERAMREKFLGGGSRTALFKPTDETRAPAARRSDVSSRHRVVIDAGHGGKDPGAVSVLGYYEKSVNLAVALELAGELRAKGIQVQLTRSSDRFIELNDRAAVGNSFRANLFVSIHADASESSSAQGYTVYIRRLPRAGDLAAARLIEEALRDTGIDSRGIRNADYRVLVRSAGPAVLVEMGFLSNREEAGRLRQRSFMNLLVRSLARGITDYLRSTGPTL